MQAHHRRGESKNAKKRGLRIYFATDLHGSEVCFRKFLARPGCTRLT